MKRRFITCILVIVLLAAFGYTYGAAKVNSGVEKSEKLVNTKTTEAVNQYIPINPYDVVDYTIASNSYKEIIRHHPLIRNKTDLEKYNLQLKQAISTQVKELAPIVNTFSEMRKATKDEINSIGYKRRIPLTFIMKDKVYVHVVPIMKKESSKNTPLGKLVQIEPYTDRFIIDIEKSDKHEYYTLYSRTAIMRILKLGDDIPGNDFFSMEPINKLLREGDKLTLSGLGNTNGDIKMFVETDKTSDSHLIFDIGTFEGEWKIEFNVRKSFKAMDGTAIELSNHK